LRRPTRGGARRWLKPEAPELNPGSRAESANVAKTLQAAPARRGIRAFSATTAPYRLLVVLCRHQPGSALLRSKLAVDDWGRCLGGTAGVTVRRDRLLPHAHRVAPTLGAWRDPQVCVLAADAYPLVLESARDREKIVSRSSADEAPGCEWADSPDDPEIAEGRRAGSPRMALLALGI